MKWALLAVACVSMLMCCVGCSSKEDTPEAPTEVTQPDLNSPDLAGVSTQPAVEMITLDEVLQDWAAGRQDQAVDLFLKVQWEQPGVFAQDSIFGISEEAFAKLPADQREQIVQKALKLSKDIKELLKFIVQQAKQKGGYEVPRNKLIACGKRLSRDDQLLLIQLVGKAVVGYTEKELPVF